MINESDRLKKVGIEIKNRELIDVYNTGKFFLDKYGEFNL
jgi:hypothetical protein